MTAPTPTTTEAGPTTPAVAPTWQRWLPRASALVSAFTTLCCLGLSALVSLSTAIGATFLTQDATLRPLLAASLLLSVVGSVFTWRRHRDPLPVLLTVTAAATIFWSVYGGTGHTPGGDAGHGMDHTDDATAHGAATGGLGVWAGLILLLTGQVWDTWRLRRLKKSAACATC